ncbi:uncharacterized protein LTHEOB_5229 [Lasiodiplodia theobromae]|uniref:uncharacterized protein n=1 Tax=Lasiodiplodia theobromae TaxID=45133 RepID=UPI0015C30DE7|nr:uncharacterized protein LTHEOB_5229 [Lasiodiplodia theobromae]KAF4545396.1 hypothetical protein LTHEOB_5229 [Lasiodiplodia theobromae]
MDPPQAEKPAVPKFSSFKPKPPPPAPPKEPSPNHDDEKHRRRRDHHEDRERDHKSHRDRHSRSHRDDRDRRHRDRDRDHLGDDVIYVIDRKGDLANLQYGRLHQYSVPPYYRAGYGSVLGLPSYARIDRFSSDDRTIIIDMRRRHGGSERQLLSKRVFGKEAPILRLVKPTHSDTTGELDQNQDFIPVRSLKRKRGSESPEPEAEKIDYRSIEGKAKPPNQPEDSDLERVQDEPNDLQTWLDLLKSSELHALASLRFDIYQRALKVLKSERLVAALMDESSKIHQREEHFNRWKETNLAEFHFEDSQHLRVYVFLRLTSLMKHAGYHERAIALWQALLELQLFRPPTFGEDTPKSSILQDFEEFWESECPRFGETGAVGWANARQDGVFPDPPESTIQDEEVDISLRRLFESFSQKETHRMNVLQWPGRTTDEFGEDDPFHVVLYSDIKNELQLLTRSWWLDPFLRSEKLNATVSKHLLLTTSAEPEVDSHYELDNWNPPAECFQVTTDDLFSKGFFSGTRNQEQLEWLSRSLKTLAGSISDDSIAEYYLAFEWHCNPTGAAKAAKALLKKQSSSLRLYNAYALIESRSGKSEAANRVFSMAIGMSNQLPAEARKHIILLWRSWIWEALRTDDLRSARHRLSSIGDAKPEPKARSTDDDDDKFHPATVLKVRNTLVEGRDHSISVGDTVLAVYYAECLALFTYIQEGSNIEAALSTFLEMSSLLQARGHLHSAANEIAHQLQCQLLSYHSKRVKLFKPVITRSVVHESITLFPNNTKFLAMYAANEARFRVDDRVRAIMHDVVLQQNEQSIVGWLFAIYSELKRGENLGGTTHAVRAAFEKAIDSESGKKSSALWSSYVLYLVSTADRAAAKRVFFRGLLHLPYSKAYLMLAFAHLVDDLDFKELRSVYNTLQEKELRVHVEIEEEIEDVQRAIDRRRRSLPAAVESE